MASISTLGHPVFREDVRHPTKIASIFGNWIDYFINAGPEGENWNKSINCFYNWIDNTSKEMCSIEPNLKDDTYGLEVSNRHGREKI
jgi:hypothetical protein